MGLRIVHSLEDKQVAIVLDKKTREIVMDAELALSIALDIYIRAKTIFQPEKKVIIPDEFLH